MRQASDIPVGFTIQEIAKCHSLLREHSKYGPCQPLPVDQHDGIPVLGQFQLSGPRKRPSCHKRPNPTSLKAGHHARECRAADRCAQSYALRLTKDYSRCLAEAISRVTHIEATDKIDASVAGPPCHPTPAALVTQNPLGHERRQSLEAVSLFRVVVYDLLQYLSFVTC